MNHDYLFLPSNEGKHEKIISNQLIMVEAGKTYCVLVTDVGKYYTELSMDSLAQKLGASFCRIHRSYIVSLYHLKTIEPHWVHIHDRDLPVSKTYRQQFYVLLNLLS